jgi:hypothetical protein
MIEPFGPMGVALGVGAYFEQNFRAWLQSDELKNFFDELKSDFQASQIPDAKRKTVWDQVGGTFTGGPGLRVDPDFLHALFRYLDNGSEDALEALRHRLQQLLVFDDEEIDDGEIVKLIIGSLQKRRTRIKASIPDALRLEVDVILSQVDSVKAEVREGRAATEAVGADVKTLTDEVRSLRAEVVGTGMAAPPPELTAEEQGAETERLIRELDDDGHPDEARQLRVALQAGGVDRLVELVSTPQPWLEGGSAQLWLKLAKIVENAYRYEAAEQAYLRAAEHAGVPDRVRTIMRAAFMAQFRADDVRYKELAAQAGELDADHPTVVIADVQQTGDPDAIIERLSGLQGLDAEQEAAIHALLASAYLNLGNQDEARTEFDSARAADPASGAVQQIRAAFAAVEARARLAEHEQPDAAALAQARGDLERLRDQMLAGRRLREAGSLSVRAVDLALLGHDLDTAGQLVDSTIAEPGMYQEDGQRLELAEAAVKLGRVDAADQLLQGVDGDEAEFLRAWAGLLSEDAERVGSAAEFIQKVVKDPEHLLRRPAAFALLDAAIRHPSVEWSDEAEEIVAEDSAVTAAQMKAERLRRAGKIDEAEAALTPYQAHRPVLRMMVAFRAEAKEWDRALRLSERLLKGDADEDDRLRHCALLRESGERDQARAEFLALARDDRVSGTTRSMAYAEAAQILDRDGNYRELERVAEEWFRREFRTDDAGWLRLHALTRLTEFDEALALWREHQLPVDQEQHALLVAQVWQAAAPPHEAIPEIRELADQFPSNEQLLLAVLGVSLRHPNAELPEEVGAQVTETFEIFFERFPHSTALRRFAIDEDDVAGSLGRLLQETQGDRPTRIRDTWREVITGNAPVAVFATVVGRSTGQTLLDVPVLPLGYDVPEVHELEVAAAADALDKSAAALDPSSLFIVGGLGAEFEDLVMNMLPASVVAQATLDDAAADAMIPAGDAGRLALDEETGDAVLFPPREQDQAREILRAAGTLNVARRLDAKASRDPDADDDLNKLLDQIDRDQLSILLATTIVARRQDLPVFSDDRVARAAARSVGIPAFGTVALLDALQSRALIDEETRRRLRRRLHASRAWGLQLTADELVAIGQAAGWKLTPGLVATFNDSWSWRNNPAAMIRLILPCLRDVLETAPEEFDIWVERTLDAFTQASPDKDDAARTRALILMALEIGPEPPSLSPDQRGALFNALRSVPWYLQFKRDRSTDIVIEAIARLLEWTAPKSELEAAGLLRVVLARLSEADRALAMKAFVRSDG